MSRIAQTASIRDYKTKPPLGSAAEGRKSEAVCAAGLTQSFVCTTTPTTLSKYFSVELPFLVEKIS
jgi:hypothetical protein